MIRSDTSSWPGILRSARLVLWGMLLSWPLFVLGQSANSETGADRSARSVIVLEVDGPIGPATADYIASGLERAAEAEADLLVLRMDTPGGLDTAMRQIIKGIVGSPVPVATYVAPSGARAASAGTYIMYASHIAAMAPGTNLGAATPVQIGGGGPGPAPSPGGEEKPADDKGKDQAQDGEEPAEPAPTGGGGAMERKVVNDAVAYIRGLAELRGRNADWAEKAVRQAASLHAQEAVRMNVADVLASSTTDLLQKVDGRTVEVQGQEVKLALEGATIEVVEPDWRHRLLAIITNPNVAYILMMLGVYGIFFELWNPGYMVPGVVGGISLLLALYAFQVLPVNYAGLGLILLGMAFIVGEVFMPSFGVLGIGGIIAFVVGSIILLDTGVEGYEVAWQLIVTVALLSSAVFFGVVTLALKSRNRAVVSGQEQMIGATGEALEGFADQGRVQVFGESWRARSRAPIANGQRVRVVGMEGLTLVVEPYEQEGT